ncbi:MAG TPA: hypothetical protein PLC88_01880 [Syntrophomonas sp.]|nr:hypothetical protein [Syntrophomonas sp.]HRW12656.1 hypothetical protein [Syntrophomonas sp.]
MNKNNRIIVIILAVLFITTTIGVIVNQRYAADRKALLEATEIAVRESGQEVARLNMTVLGSMKTVEFTARLKSSLMEKPKEHTYTGIAFADLFTAAGISLEEKQRVLVYSVDGYVVPLSIKEIKEFDNIYLVYKDNGNYLGSYEEADGQGPYMIVIRGDRFSQRWAKYVCELDVQ